MTEVTQHTCYSLKSSHPLLLPLSPIRKLDFFKALEEECEMATYSSGNLPGKFHGQRSLAGYSPQDHKEFDMIEHAHTFRTGYMTLGKLFNFSQPQFSCLGKGLTIYLSHRVDVRHCSCLLCVLAVYIVLCILCILTVTVSEV